MELKNSDSFNFSELEKEEAERKKGLPFISKNEDAKRKIRTILDSLKKPISEYNPLETLQIVGEYIKNKKRLLYSEITHCVYALSERERVTVGTNLDRLINYATDSNNAVFPSLIDCISKIWDHFNLACYQLDNSKDILLSATEETQEILYIQLHDKLHKDLSGALETKLEKKLYDQLYERFKSIEREVQ